MRVGGGFCVVFAILAHCPPEGCEAGGVGEEEGDGEVFESRAEEAEVKAALTMLSDEDLTHAATERQAAAKAAAKASARP